MNQSITDPLHIAFILDGNRRWAKKNLTSGHKKGIEVAKDNILNLIKLGIPYASYYIFSKDNNRRSKEEVTLLKAIFNSFFNENGSFIAENKIKINILGDVKSFDENLYNKLQNLIQQTNIKDHKITLNLAINYSARSEILRAVKNILKDNKNPNDLTEQDFEKYLYTKGMKDPDLLIRTGGEKRLSDFLLWQSSYSEIFFKDVLWPDFKEQDLLDILQEYKTRERRYGK